jgi:hypothetical protein
MTQRKKSQNIGLLMIVVFSAVFLWALTAMLWPVPVVYAEGPEIITLTVTSSLETYFYDPGLDPTGGTVYFNSLAGEGAGQVLTVTVTCSGTITHFEGAPAFDNTPPPDTSAPWEITYTVEMGAETQNGIVFTVTNALSQTDTAVITFTQDITDPTIVSPTINEDSDYLYADALTLYYSNLMNGTPQSFTVQGNATDNDGAGLDQATFSSAFGVTPPADDDPANWSGTYDDVESGDNGDGTITVTVTDNVGNWSEKTFHYTEDTTNPTVTLTYVTPGGYDEDDPDDWLDADGSNWYDPDNLSAGWYFTSTVTDTLSGLALANASWDHSNDAYDQLTYDPGLDGGGVFNGVSDDGDGVVTVTLTITDHVGNSASDLIVFNLDNTDPTITSPAITEDSVYLYADDLTVYYGDDMGGSQAFTIQGNAQDSEVGLDYVAYSAALGEPYYEDSDNLENWHRDYTANQYDTTSGVITVTVYDRVGNFATQNFTYTRDTDSPIISYDSPPIVEDSPYLYAPYPDGTTVYYSHQMGGTPHSFTVQGSAADNDGAGLDRATFSSPHLTDPGPDNDPAEWSGTYNVDSSESGSGTITVKVYDNVSNWSQRTFNYVEDTTAPTVELTDVTDPGYDYDPDWGQDQDELDTDGSNWYNAGDFTAGGGGGWAFTSDTDDDGAGPASGTAAWDHSNNDFDRPIRDCGPEGDGIFLNASGDGEGTVTVTVTIADHVGNSASDTVLFSIDNTEPTITSPYINNEYGSPYLHVDGLTIYYGDDMTGVAAFTVNGHSSDGDGVGLNMTDTVDFSTALWDNPSNSGTREDWSGEYSATSSNTDSGTIYVTVYDLLDNAASQTFDYFRDTESPTVDVTCPPVSSDPSWSVSWSGNDSPPPASGLKHFDVQFSEVSSDGPWQDWHTDTDSTEDIFGPNSPVIVEDDHTYYFRVRAEDNVSNESSYTNGQDATLYHSGIKKVFLPILIAPDPNWGFETGDFTSWQHGGELVQSVSAAEPHSGNYSALLGSPSYNCAGGVPKGSAWLRRSVTVPSSGSPILRFWYKLYTQDKNTDPVSEEYDFFAVYINGNQELIVANTTDNYGCSTLNELEDTPIISLDGYQGETIPIAFYVYNKKDGWYNTYVYIDTVSVE